MIFHQKKIIRSFALFSACVCIVHTSIAQTIAKDLIPLDPQVKTGRLPNGFTYFIRHNQEPKNRVLMFLVNKVGSVLENDSQQGLAHFLEHMNFNGTTHYPKNELIAYLEKSGVRFGADLNAYTNFDETVYQLPIASDDPKLLANGLQIMRDWAHGATLDPVEIDQERGVILEEKRTRSGVGQRTMEKTFPVILNNALYAKRLPIGKEDVLKTFKPATIRNFYDQWYRPDLQALIIVGDVDAAAMEQSVKTLFADLKNPQIEQTRPSYSVPLTGGSQFLTVTDPEAQTISIELINKFRTPQMRTRADYRNGIIRNLVNSMVSARLSELNQQPNLPYLSAGAGMGTFLADLDVFSINMTVKPGQIDAGFKAVYTETERLKRYGFSATELARAKKNYMAGMESMVKEKDKTNSANYVNEYVNYFLKGEASPGIVTEYAMTTADMKNIELKDVNNLLKERMETPDRDIIINAPEKDKSLLPDENTIYGWIVEIQRMPLKPYTDGQSIMALLAVKPIPGKVIDKKEQKELGITQYELSNGVKIVFKPTNFKNDEIIFNGFKAGGTSLSSDGNYQSAANAAAIIAAGGVGPFNADQLQKSLTGKNVSVGPYINELYEGIQGAASPEDLETAFQLLYLYFTQPRKDTVVFDNLMTRVKSAMINRSNNPEAVFNDTITAVLGNHNLRRMTPGIDQINNINLDKAFEFYKSCFDNANGYTFVFTGAFNQEQLLDLCQRYLGGLPSGQGSQPGFRDLNIHIPPGIITKTVYQGAAPKATVQMVYSGAYQFNPENNLQLSALSDVIELRLLDRLRELEGGVYTPQSNVSYSKLPQGRYAISINFSCAPGNVEKLILATEEEVNKLKISGIPVDDLSKFKAEYLRSLEVQQQTNTFWLGYISGQLRNGSDPEEVLRNKERIEELQLNILQQAARQCLNNENLIKLILKPKS